MNCGITSPSIPQSAIEMTCIAGHCVLVTVVVNNPAANGPPDEVMISYPSISGAAIQVTLCYAGEISKELYE